MEEQTSILQDPRLRALGRSLIFFIVYLLLGLFFYFAPQYFFADPTKPGQYVDYNFHMLLDAGICMVGMAVWLVFFAQFALPVKTITDRLKMVDRLVTYLFGGHGPALFVENGIVRAKEGETKRQGPGVIWMDSASAAVLRTGVAFTRTIGPGVHFTKYGEYIAATVDLHPLSQTIGPLDTDVDDKDPFKATKEKAPEYFESIQKRRWETSALTRDGIEVVAVITVNFRIAAKEGEGQTRFGFNAANTEKAIRDSITRGADLTQPVWSELPARMAVDVWREYLRKFRLSELFDTADDRLETAIQAINALVGKRLKQKEVENIDAYGRVILKSDEECKKIQDKHISENRYAEIYEGLKDFNLGQFDKNGLYAFLLKNGKAKDAEEYVDRVASREYNTLSEMGLEVMGVTIKRIVFAPDIEERIVSQWTTLWKKNAEKERDQVDRERKQAETKGQEDALKDFAADAAGRDFSQVAPSNKFLALEMLVHNTFLGVRRNPALLKRTNTEQRELSDIFSWLRDRGAHSK